MESLGLGVFADPSEQKGVASPPYPSQNGLANPIVPEPFFHPPGDHILRSCASPYPTLMTSHTLNQLTNRPFQGALPCPLSTASWSPSPSSFICLVLGSSPSPLPGPQRDAPCRLTFLFQGTWLAWEPCATKVLAPPTWLQSLPAVTRGHWHLAPHTRS